MCHHDFGDSNWHIHVNVHITHRKGTRKVKFEWDPRKAAANLRKHGVAFQVAELVWDDPGHLVLVDRYENGEDRRHAIGLVRGVMILTVVHAYPDGDDDGLIRIIGARAATRVERRRYDSQND